MDALQFNAREVTIPFFRVGVTEINLSATIDAVTRAIKAQQPAKKGAVK